MDFTLNTIIVFGGIALSIKLGNLAIAALLFGQLISGKPLDIWLTILGIAVAIACYGTGYLLLKEEKER